MCSVQLAGREFERLRRLPSDQGEVDPSWSMCLLHCLLILQQCFRSEKEAALRLCLPKVLLLVEAVQAPVEGTPRMIQGPLVCVFHLVLLQEVL